jgi:protein phosphatase PTC7
MKTFATIFTIWSMIGASPIKFKFEFAMDNIPSPEKKDKGGEDSSYGNPYVISVADGVGGWNEHGVDPAKYSRRLAMNTEILFKRNPAKYRKNPKSLLIDVAKSNKETGSSTFVIATIDPESNLLKTTYIGDSSYILLRKNQSSQKYKTVYRSVEQQHRFNYPFQIGSIGDEPSEALEFSHKILENDLLILGTDGLFDNLFDKQILQLVNDDQHVSLEKLAKDLDLLAYEKSLDASYVSPFAEGARKAGFYYVGGKSDDITTIVARIVTEAEEESDSL